MPRVFVEANSAGVIGLPVGSDHLYLVYQTDSGDDYVIGGGPGNAFDVFGGEFVFDVNEPIESSGDSRGDESSEDRFSTEVFFSGRTADEAWSIMVKYARLLDEVNYPYFATHTNSNALVGALLTAAGVEPEFTPPDTGSLLGAVGFDSASLILSDVPPPADGIIRGTPLRDFIDGAPRGGEVHGEVIWTFSGDDLILAGGGNDIIRSGQGADIISGGSGSDIFLYDLVDIEALSLSAPFDTINDFNQGDLGGIYSPSEGDRIDISAIVGTAFFNGESPESLWRLKPWALGSEIGKLLEVDADGSGDLFDWTALAFLTGVPAGEEIDIWPGEGGGVVSPPPTTPGRDIVTIVDENFDDNVLNGAPWSYFFDVKEVGNQLRISQSTTDLYSSATYTFASPIRDFDLSMDRYYHPANSWYFGSQWFTLLGAEGQEITVGYDLLKSAWGPDYGNVAGNFNSPRYYINEENGGILGFATQVKSSDYYDRWINSSVSFDTSSGTFTVDLDSDGVAEIALTNAVLVGAGVEKMSFNSYGWWTGHYSLMDNLLVTGREAPGDGGVKVINGLVGLNDLLASEAKEVFHLAEGLGSVAGTLKELSDDVITGFTDTIKLVVENVKLLAEWVKITFGSAILDIDEDGDGDIDGTITLEGDFEGAVFNVEIVGEDTEITVEFPPEFNLIEGTDGRDDLVGTAGADRIVAMAGTGDRLTGGAGADEFLFSLAAASNGLRETKTILDFEVGVDTLVLEGGLAIESFRAMTGGAVIGLSGGDRDQVTIRGAGIETADDLFRVEDPGLFA